MEGTQATLLKKGAEADTYLERWHGRMVVRKSRLQKAYRVDALDKAIRARRTIREALLIHGAKMAGVPTPTVIMVDPPAFTIIMEYLEGPRLKEALERMDPPERLKICELVGRMIGRLHRHGMVHGDLTTSNMILANGWKVYFIDFGLAYYSTELEDRGSDLLLMKRSMKSTHHGHHAESFKAILSGYRSVMGDEATRYAVKKVHEIELRGRYSERA